MSAALQDEPRTLEEMHARAVAARNRQEQAALNRTPKPPAFRVVAPGQIGREAFEAARLREEAAAKASREQLHHEIARTAQELSAAQPRELPRRIIARVAKAHGLTPDDLIGPSQRRSLVRARWEAMAEVRRVYPDRGLIWLGRQFGGRDHTTVLNALRKMGLK